jgi:PAS domain S-box-containing protein
LALRESENKFRIIAENSPAMVAIFQDGKIKYASQMLLSITGYPIEEALKMDFLEMVDPEYRDVVKERNRRRLAGEEVPSRYEIKLRTKQGAECWIDFSGGIMTYEERPAVLGIALDVTERRATEKRLAQREVELAHVSRLTTMGEMVAGIAHEINQPLSAMSNYADACMLALGKIDDDRTTQIKQWAEQIGQQAVRCGDIIKRLRQYVKQKQTNNACVNINNVIQDSVALMRTEIRQNVSVECDLDDPSTSVRGNPVELQQVIVNLLANAHEAAQHCESSRQKVTLRSTVAGEFLRIDVEDNGPGIHAENLDRLYDAFFTTKSDGIGMGLAISRSIVERHNGRLWAENKRPHGAAFHLELPLV